MAFSISRSLQFRFDFVFRIFLDIFTYILNIFFFKSIFQFTDLLGGWNEGQMMIFVSSCMVFDGLRMALFSSNTYSLPMLINQGSLDYYLLRPVSPVFFLSLRDFSVNSAISLIFAVGLLTYSILHYEAPITTVQFSIFVFLLLNGVYLSHLIHLILILPVFWIQGGRGFESMYWVMQEYVSKPHKIFMGWTRWLLVTLLPFSVMAALPVESLFNERPFEILFYCIATSLVFTFFFSRLWSHALRSYSSASS